LSSDRYLIKHKEDKPNTFENSNKQLKPIGDINITQNILTNILEDEGIVSSPYFKSSEFKNHIEEEDKNLKLLRKRGSKCDLESYYEKLFGLVKLKLDPACKDEFEAFKLSTFNDISNTVPKFPIVKYMQITRESLPLIELEWILFEKAAIKIDPQFKLKSVEVSISFKIIMNKLQCPPIIACFLGLLIGMSGMREILFSDNHYITNMVNALYLTHKSLVVFLYIASGISMIQGVKGFDLSSTPITKKYLAISFVNRYVLLPGIGIIYVYFWKTYYGGIVATSKVFRAAMFFPFCMPCSATVAVVANLVKYFVEETGIILFAHNATIALTLTILYLISYVVIGG